MDSNGDGIGDLKGIEQRLDYIAELGCNALWINPFYKSPFRDGGYDVEDFFDVDPRFGTIENFKSLVKAAHKKGIKIILDLVAGHASIDNKEFIKSGEPQRNNKYDLFIWNDSVWEGDQRYRLISGAYQRNGAFLVNFFAHQPAFNYGFYNVTNPWQMSYLDERTYQAREYMLNVMRHWLSLGADGFRVDMADSLVKNDPDKKGTIEVWKYLFGIIRKEYPDAYFVAEWANPFQSLEAGFDADFVLDHWDCFYHRLVRSNEKTRGISALNGGNDINLIMDSLSFWFNEAKKHNANVALISGNHDTPRIADSLSLEGLKAFYLFMLSMPGTPFIYYGDELMMKTLDIDSKDGGYQRTGSRTPMIWDDSEPNHGFSTTKGELYLPFGDINKISVESAIKDNDSLYHFIKKMIELRKDKENLTSPDFEISEKDRVITIRRGNKSKIILNLSNNEVPYNGNLIISSKENQNKTVEPLSAVLVEE